MTLPAPVYALLPALAALLLVVAMGTAAAGHGQALRKRWVGPALLSCGLTLWTVYAVAVAGPTGFWPEHQRGAWGNQIWFDLLIAIGIGWALILPRARMAGMRRWPWLIFILCSGCIGLSAMLARLLWLEAQRPLANGKIVTPKNEGETP